jgi:transcriptional regulator with XRE-family HTH domain
MLAGLTQPQLGARAGVARETIARIENGRPASRAVLTFLADALQVEPAVLASAPPTDSVQESATGIHRVQPSPPRPKSLAAAGLRRWRTQANLTQPQLARRAGVARETIARIENGRAARHGVLLRLAEALRVPPSVLTGSVELDALIGAIYRTCNCCTAVKPLTGFVRVRGTPYVYLRCRECRARVAKERYYRTSEIHEAEKRRARENGRMRRLRQRLSGTQQPVSMRLE